MTPTTPTTSGKTPLKPFKPAPGNVKRDINLLPANENAEKMTRNLAIGLGVLISLLLLAYFAIIMPSMILSGLQSKADSAQNQIKLMAGADKDFNDRVAQRDELKQMIDSLNSSVKDYLQPADLFDNLSRTCPDSITLTAVTQADDGLLLDGQATNDGEVAQFIVNLRTIQNFDRVVLVNVKDAENSQITAKSRVFEIKCLLPVPAASASPLPEPSATQGGAAK